MSDRKMIELNVHGQVEIFSPLEKSEVAGAAVHPTLEALHGHLDRLWTCLAAAVIAVNPSISFEATRTQAPQVPGVQIFEPHPASANRLDQYEELKIQLEEAVENPTVIYGPDN